MKKIVVAVMAVTISLIIGGILFIKFNTTAAANFTDDVLRPILGSNNVIFLEKIFFNTSDKVQQLSFQQKNLREPQFSTDLRGGNLTAENLDLQKISVDKNFSPLANEGQWKIMKLAAFSGQGAMAYTFVRPDLGRPFSIVTIVQADMKKMNLGTVAGIKEPGGKVGNPGPGVVPEDIVKSNRLVAAFDGGFQFRDGEYGMVVGNKTYLPLKTDLGTVVGYKNGEVKIVNYIGQDLGKDVVYVRQNCPILIDNGQMAVTDEKNKKLWGRTITSAIFTWRTGMGLNKQGNLLFAVGNNLTPETLARALEMAGAVNAIQLDINPNWVRFNIFSPLGNGNYGSTTLTRDLKDGSKEYLNGDNKDFFYLYKK